MRAKFVFAVIISFFAALIRYSLAAFWLYAATIKLIDHKIFVEQLSLSPLLGNYASPVSFILPVFEFITALLLIFTSTLIKGFYASISLLLIFAAYISYLYLFAPSVPCACGGLFKNMGWIAHLKFNLISAVVCFIGLYLSKSRTKPAPENLNLYITNSI